MDRFKRYLDAFDGTRAWAEIQPLFDDAFHQDCVYVTADGELDKGQWAEMAKGLADKKAVVSGFQLLKEQDDSAIYELTITMGQDKPLHLTAKGTLKGGQLVRVEPVDPAAYSTMVERSK